VSGIAHSGTFPPQVAVRIFYFFIPTRSPGGRWEQGRTACLISSAHFLLLSSDVNEQAARITGENYPKLVESGLPLLVMWIKLGKGKVLSWPHLFVFTRDVVAVYFWTSKCVSTRMTSNHTWQCAWVCEQGPSRIKKSCRTPRVALKTGLISFLLME
jgi:hypothetical protein